MNLTLNYKLMLSGALLITTFVSGGYFIQKAQAEGHTVQASTQAQATVSGDTSTTTNTSLNNVKPSIVGVATDDNEGDIDSHHKHDVPPVSALVQVTAHFMGDDANEGESERD